MYSFVPHYTNITRKHYTNTKKYTNNGVLSLIEINILNNEKFEMYEINYNKLFSVLKHL